jgi:membrane protein required for colicin V production
MLDIILLLVLAFAAYKGWRAGSLSMLLGLALLVVAALLASTFAGSFGTVIGVSNAYLRPVIGFIAIFVGVLILGKWIRKFIRPKRGILRGADGLLGAVLGLIRGVILVSVLLVILRLVHLPSESARENSVLYPVVLKTSTSVIHVLRPYARLPERDTTV